jgi:hypothetical protein
MIIARAMASRREGNQMYRAISILTALFFVSTLSSGKTSFASEETSVLGQLAVALTAGGGALRRFRGSTVKNKEGKASFNPLNPPIQGMDCSIDDVADYVSCYDSAIGSKQEADRRFIELINELQAVLPAHRWRGVEKEPGIDSIQCYTYTDQNSDAHIDLDLIVQLKTGGEYFYLVTIFGWAATEPRL